MSDLASIFNSVSELQHFSQTALKRRRSQAIMKKPHGAPRNISIDSWMPWMKHS